jgi:FhuF 2Fe-2S C-terminal domain
MFADVAPIGPFFSVATGTAPSGGGWVPLRALHGDAAPLRTRVAAVRAALGTDDRVAASTAFQGVAAQVVAPLFGAAALVGALPAAGAADPGPGRLADVLHWRPGGGGPWLWWAGTAGRVVACADPGAAALGGAVTGLLGPIVAAVRAQVSISERVLWGDVASAVASARRLVVAARPEAAQRATAVAERLLGGPLLARTAALRAPEPPDLAWTFRRRSCCLYYRVPGGAVCGDCVLLDRRPRR